MGHARALINVKDLETQMNIFNDAVANGFSVREVEQLVRTFADIGYKQTSKPKTPTIPNSLPFSSQQKIHNLSKYLEKDIDIKRNAKELSNAIDGVLEYLDNRMNTIIRIPGRPILPTSNYKNFK